MPAPNSYFAFIRRQPRWRFVVVLLVLAAVAFFTFRRTGESLADAPTFEARRGPLDVTVLEGGNLEALESQEIKCEVKVGYQGTKILKIVEEGYLVTPQDVSTGKVLVELDSSEIEDKIIQQEIQYQSAAANLTEAQQNFEIQKNQNLSDIKAAEQKVRFTRMDFDKFLGDSVTDEIIARLGLDKMFTAAKTAEEPPTEPELPDPTQPKPARPSAAVSGDTPSILMAMSDDAPARLAMAGAMPKGAPRSRTTPAAPPSKREEALDESTASSSTPAFKLPDSTAIDFSEYANLDALGDGEAKQKIRKFEDDLQVAKKELGQATTTLDGTKRLYGKGFVTRNDLERDEIAFENSRLKVQTAETARELFLKYEFIKQAEQALSDYSEAVREYDKARRVARSKLAQATARLKSSEGQYQVQSRRRTELSDQLDKCTIRAEKPGLVVYGSAGERRVYYGNQEPIGEGATVRERQAIITIPDLTTMTVEVKIHESYIKKIKKGQRARITVDAFPDEVLEGKVTKVAVLPDSQNRWMNPDLNVYQTTVTVDGTHEWVKPGMSAKVQIFVNRLDDVVYIPIQSVSPSDGGQVCYVMNGAKPEERKIETGQFNDDFIEIKSGLKEGERVLLSPPDHTGQEPMGTTEPAEEDTQQSPKESTTTAPAPNAA